MIATAIPQDLRDYFDRIYWPKKLGKSPRTAALYRMTFDRFGEFLGKKPKLENLNDDEICGFLQHRLANGRAHHTVDKERDKLRAIGESAARKRHIPEFLELPQITPEEKLPTCWRKEQVAKLLETCATSTGTIGGAPASDWWLAFHYVCLLTGERTEAMLSLTWEMLDGDVLSVPAKYRKGRKKAKRYKLPPIALEAVEKLRGKTSGGIFAKAWGSVCSFYLHYGKLLRRAGLPDGRDFKPQCLRRTFASFLEAGGGDATAALGHSSRSVTLESYLDTGITDAGKEASGDVVGRELGIS